MIRFLTIVALLCSVVALQAQNAIEYVMKGESEKALSLLESKQSLSTEESIVLAQLYSDQFSYRKALAIYTDIVNRSANNATAKEGMAKCYIHLTKYDEAMKLYESLYKADTTNVRYGGNLARLYVKKKLKGKALKVYANIVSVDSMNVYFLKKYADLLARLTKIDLAKQVYNQALRITPNDVGLLMDIGSLYGSREFQTCDQYFQKALKLSNNSVEVQKKFARVLFACKKYKMAQTYYNKADTQAKLVFDDRKCYGISCYHAKNYEKGIKILEECMHIMPMEPYVNFYLGLSFKGLKDYDKAIQYLDDSIDGFMNAQTMSDIYHHKAILYGLTRDFNRSIDAYKNAYKLNPKKNVVLYEIATTYEESHKSKDLALKYYREFLKANAGKKGKKVDYALDRVAKIREDIFFGEK